VTVKRAAVAVVVAAVASLARADDWPQWRGPVRDGVWREQGVLEKFPAGGPKTLWKASVGAGFSGPTVANGQVYLTDRPAKPGEQIKLGSFSRNEYAALERVQCLDAADGRVLWTHQWPCSYNIAYGTGPRATPTVADGKVFVLGAMGDLLCLDAQSGKVIWHKHLNKEYEAKPPIWGFACSPLVEGGKVICTVGGRGGTVMAFDAATGREAWRALSAKEIGYSSPRVCTLAGRRQMVMWHADGLSGLDPATGQVLWSAPFPARFGMAIVTPAVDGDRLAVSCQFDGAAVFRIRADAGGTLGAEVVWKASTGGAPERQWKDAGVNTVHSPLLLRGECLFGVSTFGELCGLDAGTGKRLWTTLEASGQTEVPKDRWGSAFIVTNGDREFILNEKGELIIARLSRDGYKELDRTRLLEPDMDSGAKRKVIWSHPAYAGRSIFVRNNSQLVRVSLAAEQ